MCMIIIWSILTDAIFFLSYFFPWYLKTIYILMIDLTFGVSWKRRHEFSRKIWFSGKNQNWFFKTNYNLTFFLVLHFWKIFPMWLPKLQWSTRSALLCISLLQFFWFGDFCCLIYLKETIMERNEFRDLKMHSLCKK